MPQCLRFAGGRLCTGRRSFFHRPIDRARCTIGVCCWFSAGCAIICAALGPACLAAEAAADNSFAVGPGSVRPRVAGRTVRRGWCCVGFPHSVLGAGSPALPVGRKDCREPRRCYRRAELVSLRRIVLRHFAGRCWPAPERVAVLRSCSSSRPLLPPATTASFCAALGFGGGRQLLRGRTARPCTGSATGHAAGALD